MEIEIEEGTFTHSGRYWVNTASNKVPPETICRKLEQERARLGESGGSTDFGQLLQRAKQCRQCKAYTQALAMVERALEIRPENPGALALKCSILRDQGRLELALEVSERYRHCDHPMLLNTRAATLCDLERWEEAAEVALRSQHVRPSRITLNLIARINAARPGIMARPETRWSPDPGADPARGRAHEGLPDSVLRVDGYVLIRRPDHPGASLNGYVPEHRVVMEEYLGGPIPAGHQVHHLDRRRANNRIENLVLVPTLGLHAFFHNLMKTPGKQDLVRAMEVWFKEITEECRGRYPRIADSSALSRASRVP